MLSQHVPSSQAYSIAISSMDSCNIHILTMSEYLLQYWPHLTDVAAIFESIQASRKAKATEEEGHKLKYAEHLSVLELKQGIEEVHVLCHHRPKCKCKCTL